MGAGPPVRPRIEHRASLPDGSERTVQTAMAVPDQTAGAPLLRLGLDRRGRGVRLGPRIEQPVRPGAVSGSESSPASRSDSPAPPPFGLPGPPPVRTPGPASGPASRSDPRSSLPFRYSLRACQLGTAASDTVSHAGGEYAERVPSSNRGSYVRGEYPEPAPGADRGRHSPGECETRRAGPVLVIHSVGASVTASPSTGGRVPRSGRFGRRSGRFGRLRLPPLGWSWEPASMRGMNS
jgi:hypothetical protein